MKGQALIEVLAALGLGIVLISAITILVITSLSGAQLSKTQNLATQYAQEGMEVIRSQRNGGKLPASGTYCLDKNNPTLYPKDTAVINGCSHNGLNFQNVDTFAREVKIEEDSSECRATPPPVLTPTPVTAALTKITVKVSWSDSKCADANNLMCHNVTVVSCLSDSNVVPTI